MVYGAFHANDGLFFKRLDAETIQISFEVFENSKPPYTYAVYKTIQINVDVSTFASAVASVSSQGETSYTHKEVLDFLTTPRAPKPPYIPIMPEVGNPSTNRPSSPTDQSLSAERQPKELVDETFEGLRELIKDDSIFCWYKELIVQMIDHFVLEERNNWSGVRQVDTNNKIEYGEK